MDYERTFFDPEKVGGQLEADGSVSFRFRPEKDAAEELYVFAPKVILALNVALATERPLLVSGEPGGGKTSLARSAAAVLRRHRYQHTVTSRTQASELLWTFDALRRLNDASKQGETLKPDQHYVEPGPLWWAFDPATAAQRGRQPLAGVRLAKDPGRGDAQEDAAVALVDEIDKADPDVPNDLLEPFDRRTFTVRETGEEIGVKRRVLLILTTNRERTMPRAFLRRCVTLELADPTAAWLETIAERRYRRKDDLHGQVAAEVMALRADAKKAGVRQPSTAEYLDAVTAARSLSAKLSGPDWTEIKRALLWKSELPLPVSKPAAG
jgi:MoxR-like ATPase